MIKNTGMGRHKQKTFSFQNKIEEDTGECKKTNTLLAHYYTKI